MKKYRIIAICDPYNARTHYHGQEVLRYDGATPVEWVMKDNMTKEEALAKLGDYAWADFGDHCSYSYCDDAALREEEQLLIEEGVDKEDIDFSWYEGAGFYGNGVDLKRAPIWLEGETSYRHDTMYYRVENY